MRRALAGITAVSVAALCLTTVAINNAATASPSSQARSSQRCDPATTKPHYTGAGVPTPRHVLGFRLGAREATNQEIGRYWHAADRASDRVVTGVYAHSWQGRPLRYALVGNPSNLHRLPAIRRDLDRLRNPSTPDGAAKAIIRRTPTILWIAANVHGNEPSGGDAVVQLLHQLAVARRLRGARDPPPRDRRPDPGAEPRRPRARHALQRLLVRHEPRRPGRHAARGLGPAQAALEEPAAAVRRRAREQRPHLLLPAGRGPDLPRDPEQALPAGRGRVRPGERACLQGARLELRDLEVRLRLLRPGVRRHRPDHPDGRGGDDLRAGRRRAVPEAGATPVHVRPHHPVRRRDPSGEHPAPVARHVRPGQAGRQALPAGGEPDLQPGPPAAAPRAEAPGLRLLPARVTRARPGSP